MIVVLCWSYVHFCFVIFDFCLFFWSHLCSCSVQMCACEFLHKSSDFFLRVFVRFCSFLFVFVRFPLTSGGQAFVIKCITWSFSDGFSFSLSVVRDPSGGSEEGC